MLKIFRIIHRKLFSKKLSKLLNKQVNYGTFLQEFGDLRDYALKTFRQSTERIYLTQKDYKRVIITSARTGSRCWVVCLKAAIEKLGLCIPFDEKIYFYIDENDCGWTCKASDLENKIKT